MADSNWFEPEDCWQKKQWEGATGCSLSFFHSNLSDNMQVFMFIGI